MNSKFCKRARKLFKLLPDKPFEPVIKAYKEVVIGLKADGTEDKAKMACVTMVYPLNSFKGGYRKFKKSVRRGELTDKSTV